MAHKLVIDCDPGIDSALALSLALFSPEVEIETVGEITLGQTVFDRRGYSTEASLTSVAIEADTQEVYQRIVSGLLRAAS